MVLNFDSLAEVALVRDLLRRWWGLELGFASPDGSGYDRTSHAACATLAKLPSGACAAALAAAAAQANQVTGPVAVRCHANLTIVAAAARAGKEVVGVVYASGLRHAADVSEVERSIAGATEAIPEAGALAALAPQFDDTALDRVKDLVAKAVQAVERAQPATIPPTTFQHPFDEIVGDAPAVRDVVKLLGKLVKSEGTVLIHGESGTGKELIARAIHYHGPRAKKPFVVQNCSAFNDNLLESALFGHVRGSFTGAVKDQKGLFEVADGGTFFLDEIGDMSAALQVKLLRVLQEGTFMPVGGTKPVKVDVRIIAASHKDLETMVRQKQFREDLFFRVNVLKITVPPLRDRAADIPRLVGHFLKKHTPAGAPPPRLSQGALARLVAYPWPGNIRELENEIERMLVLAAGAPELPATLVSPRVAGGSTTAARLLSDIVATAETDAIVAALGRCAGDRGLAAAELGVSQGYLNARARALGLS